MWLKESCTWEKTAAAAGAAGAEGRWGGEEASMMLRLLELLDLGLYSFTGTEQRHKGPKAALSWSWWSWWHPCSVCMLWIMTVRCKEHLDLGVHLPPPTTMIPSYCTTPHALPLFLTTHASHPSFIPHHDHGQDTPPPERPWERHRPGARSCPACLVSPHPAQLALPSFFDQAVTTLGPLWECHHGQKGHRAGPSEEQHGEPPAEG